MNKIVNCVKCGQPCEESNILPESYCPSCFLKLMRLAIEVNDQKRKRNEIRAITHNIKEELK